MQNDEDAIAFGIERDDKRLRLAVAPVLFAHRRAVRTQPFDVGDERSVMRRAVEKAIIAQGRSVACAAR